MRNILLAAAAAALAPFAAQAVVIDGTIGAGEYAGAIITTVDARPGVDTGAQGPGSPGTYVENVGYRVYYTSDASNVYVGLQSNSPSGLNFANLYFDTNVPAPGGSDIGFEVTNNRAFVPGVPGFSPISLTSIGAFFSQTTGTASVGDVIEVSIPWTVFTTNVLGLNQPLVAPGGSLQLRTSQSFNYAGATGDGLVGDTTLRFGSQTAPAAAVPEPASWAMMVGGFGLIGGALRRRRTMAATA